MTDNPDKKEKPKPRRTGQRQKIGRDKYVIRVFLGRDAGGKRHYHGETFHGGARQADDCIREMTPEETESAKCTARD
jgi:hypothetical protein